MNTVPEDQTTAVKHFPVAVILERRPAASRWADHVWSAAGIAVGSHAGGKGSQLVRKVKDTAYFLIGDLQVTLHADECESYYYNLVSDSPRAYIVAHVEGDDQQPKPFLISMSFDEAHAYLEGEHEIYAVDVPGELYRWTEAYIIANYFPEKKLKRKLRDWSADEPGTQAS